jgi:hypothetical protein
MSESMSPASRPAQCRAALASAINRTALMYPGCTQNASRGHCRACPQDAHWVRRRHRSRHGLAGVDVSYGTRPSAGIGTSPPSRGVGCKRGAYCFCWSDDRRNSADASCALRCSGLSALRSCHCYDAPALLRGRQNINARKISAASSHAGATSAAPPAAPHAA